jgi:hypothetical protein
VATPQLEAALPVVGLRARARERLPLAALLGLTAGLYLWGLSRNGYANDFYAAAVAERRRIASADAGFKPIWLETTCMSKQSGRSSPRSHRR